MVLIIIGDGVGGENGQIATEFLVALGERVHLVLLQDGGHQHLRRVKITDPLSKLCLHSVTKHLEIVWSTGALYIRSIEPFLKSRAIGWPVQPEQKAILALIVANCGNLSRILRHYRLVKDSIELDNVQPFSVRRGLLWVFCCRDGRYFLFCFGDDVGNCKLLHLLGLFS